MAGVCLSESVSLSLPPGRYDSSSLTYVGGRGGSRGGQRGPRVPPAAPRSEGYTSMSVCPSLSVSRSVSGCQSESLTVTVMVAAVFQLEVWSGRRNSATVRVCLPAHRRRRATRRPGVCLSESVCLSVCLSESVSLRVCLSPSRCDVTTATSAGARVPAARPPASRQEVFFSFTIDQFCPN